MQCGWWNVHRVSETHGVVADGEKQSEQHNLVFGVISDIDNLKEESGRFERVWGKIKVVSI